jgi:hypothetical protein
MKIKIKQAIISAALILFGLAGVTPGLSLAQACSASTQNAIQCGVNGAGGNGQSPAQAGSNVNQTIKSIINVLSVAVGVVAVIMIIIGGFRYVTSGGKQESVAGAKSTILYAVVGLMVAALAQVIIRFVLTNVT